MTTEKKDNPGKEIEEFIKGKIEGKMEINSSKICDEIEKKFCNECIFDFMDMYNPACLCCSVSEVLEENGMTPIEPVEH